MTRRLMLAVLFPVLLGAQAIQSVSWTGSPIKYNAQGGSTTIVDGDTWNNAVCGDGVDYTLINDSNSFGYPINASVTFAKFSATASPMNGAPVNYLNNDAYSSPYGYGNAISQNGGSDGDSWKTSGLTCLPAIGGGDVLIAYVDRQNSSFTNGQLRTSGGMIKSYDHGATWTNFLHPTAAGLATGDPPQPVTSNMFATYNSTGSFSALNFVLYALAGSPASTVDQQNTYVYLTASSVHTAGGSSWCCGDELLLLRVKRSVIENLAPGDYQAFTGGNGMLDASWSSTLTSATPIYSNAGKTGLTTMQCGLPNLPGCIMIEWFYPSGTGTSSSTTWNWLSAPHPWGPWTTIRTDNFSSLGLYNPIILQASIAGSPTVRVLATGDWSTYSQCNSSNSSACLYTLYYLDATLAFAIQPFLSPYI